MNSFANLPQPHLHDGSLKPLQPESSLGDLPLYEFHWEIDAAATDLAHVFDRMPTLPGALLMDNGQLIGMISRQRFGEYLMRPEGANLFLSQPVRVLNSYARTQYLILSPEISILSAAQQALRRIPELISEPIIVKLSDGDYRLLDFHELNIAAWQLRGIETQVWYEKTHLEMLRHTRMASLGRLVDGVSHEILDPVSFIWGNLKHLTNYVSDLLGLITLYEETFADVPLEIDEYRTNIEVNYLREDIPRTLASLKTGSSRLSKLATSLQNFCHIDEVYPKAANMHESLDGVLLLLKSRLNDEIEVVKDYGHLPPIPCFIGQISQVFMNILTQAMNSLLYFVANAECAAEFAIPGQRESTQNFHPRIRIQTETCSIDGSGNRWIAIRIGHNAPTIPVELRRQIDSGFAETKPLTQETELTNSYRIITDRHRGRFSVVCAESLNQPLDGELTTEFEILLPLK
ncbi:sensor histidine kinase [Romeriopsis navalis]|uniref:sensor histidine kinase n=1 Tax=Romeriopsis navalis TaxID=2992132 RepID=UPI0021F8D913|nr:sensor histidine kinase [Romeriopsis navalis]